MVCVCFGEAGVAVGGRDEGVRIWDSRGLQGGEKNT